jgi:hypothetical protein
MGIQQERVEGSEGVEEGVVVRDRMGNLGVVVMLGQCRLDECGVTTSLKACGHREAKSRVGASLWSDIRADEELGE